MAALTEADPGTGAHFVTTTSTYLAIENSLTRYQAMTAAQPAVKSDVAYYEANIGKATSVKGLVGDYRLLSFALHAYGLGSEINAKALVTQVLEGGVDKPKALANTLPNANWKAFVSAFDFVDAGSPSPDSSASVNAATKAYVEQQLEADQGQSNPGVELALYFKRVAPTVTTPLGILADKNLLEVVQTIFNLPAAAGGETVQAQATALGKLMPLSELQDPSKLNSLIERFTANHDSKYGPASGGGATLTVTSGNTDTSLSAASSILAGVVSANSDFLSSLTQSNPIFSAMAATLASTGAASGG